MDLLRVNWLRRLLKSAWVPFAVQVAMLGAFALLVWGGLGVGDEGAGPGGYQCASAEHC